MKRVLTCFAEFHKHALVEAFIAQATVEAFNKAILHRYTRRDVMPFDSVLLLPSQDCVRGERVLTVVYDFTRNIKRDGSVWPIASFR